MANVNPIITLNMNWSWSIQKAEFAKLGKKQDLIYRNLILGNQRHKNGLKIKGWKKIHYANSNRKKAGMAILLLEKKDLKTKMPLEIRGIFYNNKSQSVRKL